MRQQTAAFLALALAVVACTASKDPPRTLEKESDMKILSPAFGDGEAIPVRYTCDGEDISPPLQIRDIPGEALALVLIVDDPDAPRGTWDHWIAYDIPPATEIPEQATSLGITGRNSWGDNRYGGPCPPSGTHRYFFRVYALSSPLGLPPGASKKEVLAALDDLVVAEAVLLGRYGR